MSIEQNNIIKSYWGALLKVFSDKKFDSLNIPDTSKEFLKTIGFPIKRKYDTYYLNHENNILYPEMPEFLFKFIFKNNGKLENVEQKTVKVTDWGNQRNRQPKKPLFKGLINILKEPKVKKLPEEKLVEKWEEYVFFDIKTDSRATSTDTTNYAISCANGKFYRISGRESKFENMEYSVEYLADSLEQFVFVATLFNIQYENSFSLLSKELEKRKNLPSTQTHDFGKDIWLPSNKLIDSQIVAAQISGYNFQNIIQEVKIKYSFWNSAFYVLYIDTGALQKSLYKDDKLSETEKNACYTPLLTHITTMLLHKI